MVDHDFRVDLVVTPSQVIETGGGRRRERPAGRVRWDELSEAKIAEIPSLQRLRRA